jgi:hypothetical protein
MIRPAWLVMAADNHNPPPRLCVVETEQIFRLSDGLKCAFDAGCGVRLA